MNTIQDRLQSMRDPAYKAFMQKLIPTTDPDRVLGVRAPQMRQLARAVYGTPEGEAFLAALAHATHEENCLHAYMLACERDFERCIRLLDAFLPYVDNWAVCDAIAPAVLGRRTDLLLPYVRRWLDSGRTYTVRFAIGALMRWYLGEAFSPEYPELVCSVESGEYYVRMMQAWYFATALAKQPDAALPYLTQRRLERWVHNKTIQKAIESHRIDCAQKAVLRTLKY